MQFDKVYNKTSAFGNPENRAYLIGYVCSYVVVGFL